MAAGTGTFVAFAGVDGSGKTTAARLLADRLARGGARVMRLDARRPDLAHPYVRSHMEALGALIWDPDAGDFDQLRLGHRHFFLLVSAWLHVLDAEVVRPALEDGAVVVTDSWSHKLLARAATRRAHVPEELDVCVAGLTKPDRTFLLDVPLDDAFRRRERFTAAETGLHDGATGSSARDGYVAFQSTVRAALLAMRDPSWHVLDAGGRSPDEVVDEVLATLAREGVPATG